MDEALFVFLKILIRLMFPVMVALFLGLAALTLRRKHRLAEVLLAACLIWLAGLSTPAVGLMILSPLESRAGSYADPDKLARDGVKYIVVLSGGFNPGPLTSFDAQGCSILRLLEGIRLWKRIPRAKLVVTGGAIPGLSFDVPIAAVMAESAVELGVPRESIIVERESLTTRDQARLTAGIVGKAPFALVTSAFHTPRSLMLFRFEGLQPIPAPSGFVTKDIRLGYGTLIPQAQGLTLTQIAMKEYLALLWQWAAHRLSPSW